MDEDTLTIKQLQETGAVYDKFIADWLFYGKAFKAGKTFIEEVVFQHPSETDANYAIRLKEAFNFPYCQNIVSIYNYFLTEKKAIREIPNDVAERLDWQKFQENCDLYGTNLDSFLNDTQKLAGTYGVAGVLIDMPPGEFDENSDVYAYLSSFTPNNILDWTFERDFETRKPVLTYLKLRESNRVYLIWTPEKWERYQLDAQLGSIEKYTWGENRLREVPFVFLPNIRDHEYFYLGSSDIVDASLVNGALTRVLSMGNEVMKLAGFPMLLYPYQDENVHLEDSSDTEEIVVGESSVLQFDPDVKNGKPAWLESPVGSSIEAILKWMDRLTEEMYRSVNLGGLHQNRDKAQTKSAVYLRYQFQQTNSVLSKKADALVESEKQIYYLWGKWQGIDNILENMSITRIKEFSIDALQVELENMIKSMESVMSDHFKTKMQKRIAKYTFPDLTNADLNIMKDEIEAKLAVEKKREAVEAEGNDGNDE